MNIGVIGCLPELPLEFPITMSENSGNMVHAIAPLKMFENAVYYKNSNFKLAGENSFRNFVNNTCSHLIITLANTITLDKPDNGKYLRLRKSLEQYKVPIIVFGLGIQAKNRDLENAIMPEEAINLVKYLSSKAVALGVRGEYTKQVIEKFCHIDNVFVTGCPSLFSNVEGLHNLKNNWTDLSGKGGVHITNVAREDEKLLLDKAITMEHFMIEPVSRFAHDYYVKLQKGLNPDVPYYLNHMMKNSQYEVSSKDKIDKYFIENYKLFRSTKTWFEFNKEMLSYAYGTRFHVNMATILSGKPALWLTHDARTRELVEFFNLPHLDLHDAVTSDFSVLKKAMDYKLFFEKLDGLFDNFNKYLSLNGLPILKYDKFNDV